MCVQCYAHGCHGGANWPIRCLAELAGYLVPFGNSQSQKHTDDLTCRVPQNRKITHRKYRNMETHIQFSEQGVGGG